MEQMPKAYAPQSVEDRIYQAWMESGYFNPDNLPGNRSEPFSIVLPPPNVTGTLHMGHAAMLAIEDAMVRTARLRGKKALWLPGTDHAAIATQSKVEKILSQEEGKTRHDLGRTAFLERVRAFAQNSHDTIVDQCKKMGSSLDWSREAYTLDDARNHAVNTAFKKMYDEGLIYRDYRVINWDPVGQTTVSDDEIVYKEVETTLYTFRYSKDFPIAISTTRPETKFGDTAVAVHPDDIRYKEFVGKIFSVDFVGTKLSITVVADEGVDPVFGTGALGVTPAHSTIDAEIARRHGLPMAQVIGEDARMLPLEGWKFGGTTTKEAREMVVFALREQGLMISEEKVMQNLSTAERSGGVIEPLPKMQWFVSVTKEFERNGKMVTLKSLMQDTVRSRKIDILPDRFEKTYFHWIDNLRDWCISRQIWFGHRIPAWYRDEGGDGKGLRKIKILVGLEAPEGEGWEQDPDTLDTWFSSGLWTFSTLGWPSEDALDFRAYHPTSVLETGYDILFFWVARMILMSTYLLNDVPFKTVYLHGLVRDEQGRKMSKSLGNIINPLDMITQYGADATRLSLLIGATPGNDVKLSEEKIAGFRNFTNKLWNIARFVEMTTGTLRHVERVTPTTLADRWILARFSEVVEKVTRCHDTFQLSLAGETLRDFTWSDFADWYLEIAKVEKGKDEILCYILERLLILWHPFMPFVTEEIYGRFGQGMAIVAPWPTQQHLLNPEDRFTTNFAIECVQLIINTIRNLRSEHSIDPKKEIDIILSNAEEMRCCEHLIKILARIKSLQFVGKFYQYNGSCVSAMAGPVAVIMTLDGIVDKKKERERLAKEAKELEEYLMRLEVQLANKEFIHKAPENVVQDLMYKRANTQAVLEALEIQRNAL